MTGRIEIETLGGNVIVEYDPDRQMPWALERCCDDLATCWKQTWEQAYWHAVYRARRTRVRQIVSHYDPAGLGRWYVQATIRTTRHKPRKAA